MHIPGLKVVLPSTPYDAKGLLISAIRDDNPVVFLENKVLYQIMGEVPDEAYTIPIGEADIKREGSDVTVVATGYTRRKALAAAESLARRSLELRRSLYAGASLEVADGRELLFKLHPNENHDRARREIESLAPRALVFESGNTNHMIANCAALVTRYSSVVYVAVALGKEVHADIDEVTLRRLLPLQNGGTSARRIADVCRRFLS